MAMAAVTDARFSPGLLDTAQRNRKLRADFAMADARTRNTPDALRAALSPFRADGTLPDYPLGSDFTEVEQRLARALTWLKSNTGSTRGKLATVAAALVSAGADDQEAMARMALSSAHGAGEWLQMRLLRLALARTQPSAP